MLPIYNICSDRLVDPEEMKIMAVTGSGLFRLPLEIRQEIYLIYLKTAYRPSPWMIYKHERHDRSPPRTPLGAVSKQFRREVLEVVERQRNFCYRVSSQESDFDGLARLYSRFFYRKLSFAEIPHLTIEIYPPHPDRPIDLEYIWKRVAGLCLELHAAPHLGDLTVCFMEDEIAKWSIGGVPNITMAVSPGDYASVDVDLILEALALITNVPRCTIHIPASCDSWNPLQDSAQRTEDSMTNLPPYPHSIARENCELLAEDFKAGEYLLKVMTGMRSAAKLEGFYGSNAKLTEQTLYRFEQIWPFMNLTNGGRDYLKYQAWSWGEGANNEREVYSRQGIPSWL